MLFEPSSFVTRGIVWIPLPRSTTGNESILRTCASAMAFPPICNADHAANAKGASNDGRIRSPIERVRYYRSVERNDAAHLYRLITSWRDRAVHSSPLNHITVQFVPTGMAGSTFKVPCSTYSDRLLNCAWRISTLNVELCTGSYSLSPQSLFRNPLSRKSLKKRGS